MRVVRTWSYQSHPSPYGTDIETVHIMDYPWKTDTIDGEPGVFYKGVWIGRNGKGGKWFGDWADGGTGVFIREVTGRKKTITTIYYPWIQTCRRCDSGWWCEVGADGKQVLRCMCGQRQIVDPDGLCRWKQSAWEPHFIHGC